MGVGCSNSAGEGLAPLRGGASLKCTLEYAIYTAKSLSVLRQCCLLGDYMFDVWARLAGCM